MARYNSTIENAIYTWAANALSGSASVIWDKQGFDRPAIPYATLNIIDISDETGAAGSGKIKLVSPAKTYKHTFSKTITVSCNIYADNNENHMLLMEKLRNTLRFDSVKELLRKSGVVFRTDYGSTDASILLDTDFEFRAQCDFVFSITETQNDTLDPLTAINFETTDLNILVK